MRRVRALPSGDVTSAIVIVRQKTICARLACAIEIGSGRYQSTVMPPRMPCVITAASAMIAQSSDPRTRLGAPQPDGEHEDQKAHGAGDEAMRVLEPDAAHHLVEREEEHEVAVRVRPVRHREPRLRARDQPAREDEDAGGRRDQRREEVKHQTLNANVIVFDSFAPIVTICVCVPSFSCQASIV